MEGSQGTEAAQCEILTQSTEDIQNSLSSFALNVCYDLVMALLGSVFTLLIMNQYYKSNTRKRLLQDKRFYEALDESHLFIRKFLEDVEDILPHFDNVNWFNFPGAKFNPPENSKQNEKRWSDPERSKCLNDCFVKNKKSLESIIGLITLPKNCVIYDMADKSFSIVNDFKLISIVNDLKSRSLNFKGVEDVDKCINKEGDCNPILVNMLFFQVLAYVSCFYDLLDYFKVRQKFDMKYDRITKQISKKSELEA